MEINLKRLLYMMDSVYNRKGTKIAQESLPLISMNRSETLQFIN